MLSTDVINAILHHLKTSAGSEAVVTAGCSGLEALVLADSSAAGFIMDGGGAEALVTALQRTPAPEAVQVVLRPPARAFFFFRGFVAGPCPNSNLNPSPDPKGRLNLELISGLRLGLGQGSTQWAGAWTVSGWPSSNAALLLARVLARLSQQPQLGRVRPASWGTMYRREELKGAY